MQAQVHLVLIGEGYVEVSITHPDRDGFMDVLETCKETLPVFEYNKKTRKYKTSILHIDKLVKVADRHRWELSGSDRLMRAIKRIKYKQIRIREAKCETDFESDLWSDDEDVQIADHQAKAVNFLLEAGGGLIGDDMGLGKTVVAIGTMCKLFEEEDEKILIVVKNSLREQWRNEIHKFTKISDERITIVGNREYYRCPLGILEDGGIDFRNATCKECENCEYCKKTVNSGSKLRKHQIDEGDIVIIGYEAMRIEGDYIAYKKHNWGLFIFDEATAIKTRSAQVSKKAIKIAESHCTAMVVCMSGTFIENVLEEMHTPLYIYKPYILGNYYSFAGYYMEKDYWGAVLRYKHLDYFKQVTKPYMLRRTIDEVWKDRPSIIETNRYCTMTKDQEKFYNKARQGVLDELKDKEKEKKINYAGILALIQYLVRAAATCEFLSEEEHIKYSCKVAELLSILEDEIGKEKQVVVFCSFPYKITPVIKRELEKAGYKTGTVDGNTKNVQKVVKAFKQGKFQILLASEVVSYGMNLQFASYVVNFNLPWNPAILDQRIARVYRRGQKHNVLVINLLTKDTIDERVLEKIMDKRKLFDDVLGYGEFRKVKKPSAKKLMALLK